MRCVAMVLDILFVANSFPIAYSNSNLNYTTTRKLFSGGDCYDKDTNDRLFG